MIPRPTVLLLPLVCLLVSGAGRYPWLAVAGIYAVPAAWNLVVIAQHTAPAHVAPGIVYALVAIVCAVGVWRAAHPRSEALTMPANHPNPRPVGPPSTAPPIASPRPGGATMPAPRRTLATLATLAVMLLIVACIPSASAEIIYDEDLIQLIDTSETGHAVGTAPGAFQRELRYIWFRNIENHPDLSYIAFDMPGANVHDLSQNLIPEGEFPFTYTSGGITKSGVGYVSRTTNALGQITQTKLIMFFNDWDVTGLTGRKEYSLDFQPGYLHSSDPVIGATGAPIELGWYWNYDLRAIGSNTWVDYSIASSIPWVNHLKVEKNTYEHIEGYQISLERIIDEKTYGSELNITKNGISKYYNNQHGVNVYPWYAVTDIDTVTVTNPQGINYVFPLESGDPSNQETIYTYVRSSQTGDLLTGAHLTVIDSHASSTPAIDQDLPTGTGTFTLEKADTLRYHASATADGYTLLSPIIFGVPEGGTTIALWMSPDAAPDVPTEEGKSPLYGYAITQGSQQPISGATVSLDGYGSTTTTSTGFYLFNNVTPGTCDISASAPLHDALSESITVGASPTQHNLALKGQFLLTVSAKDADDLTNLHNTTISLSDGQESTQNPATFTADYGPYTITAAAGGYYPQIQSAYLDKPGTTTATVLLTAKPEPVPPPEMPNYPPHNVKFTIQTLLGTPIPGVNVTAQGIQQTPSTNIIERLLGINMTSTPINTELMSGTTDTNGEINFMMIEAVKYRISLYKPDSVDQTLEIYPKEDTYPIIISTAGGPLLPDAGDALRDIHINVTTSTEGDSGHIHIDYNDTTRKTTSLTIRVTQQNTTDTSAPEDVIASHTVANDANVTHTFDLLSYKGQSFFVRLEAEHPDFGTVHRDYAVAFKGVRVPLGPLPDGLYIYVAGFGLMLLGGIFGATSATRGVVVIAFAGWLFWGFGWLDDLGLIAPVSLGLVSTIAVMGVIITRYREEGYQ